MAVHLVVLSALCLAALAAPPQNPRLYQQHAPAHLQSISPLDYFMDNVEVSNYYNQKQSGSAPARLETLEPDSEVELIPGAQQPQPPQQTPVSPNLPGLVPGQRVFIVHMPVPGYRPGTIGGYQPVYIVAAAPQGNNGYANGAPGFQNAVLVNPGQGVVSPFFGYPGQAPAGLVLGGLYNRPFEQAYHQDPQGLVYQPAPAPQGADGRPLHLTQLVNLQSPPPTNSPRNVASETSNTQPKSETQESSQETRSRPTPAHSQTRNKA